MAADGQQISDDQIAFAPIAEQRHEVGDQAVKRLDDPGQVENGDEGGDLERRPAQSLFEIIVERLRNQADDLAHAFDDIDQRTKYQEAVYGSLVVGCRGGRRRKRRLVHRIDRCSCRTRDRYKRLAAALEASPIFSSATIVSTISRGWGAIETVIGRSSAVGSSRAANWLSSSCAGMK